MLFETAVLAYLANDGVLDLTMTNPLTKPVANRQQNKSLMIVSKIFLQYWVVNL